MNEEKYVVEVDEDDNNYEDFFSFCGNKKIQNSYNEDNEDYSHNNLQFLNYDKYSKFFPPYI